MVLQERRARLRDEHHDGLPVVRLRGRPEQLVAAGWGGTRARRKPCIVISRNTEVLLSAAAHEFATLLGIEGCGIDEHSHSSGVSAGPASAGDLCHAVYVGCSNNRRGSAPIKCREKA